MMITMDTKFGRTYCAISDVRTCLDFQLQLPQHFIDGNGTYYGILRAIEVYKICLRIVKFCS